MMVPIKKEETRTTKRSSKRKTYLNILYVLVGISVLFLFTAFMISKSNAKSAGSGRQAVFVTTGSVYFGFVKDESSSMVQIDDVYYLNSVQSLYPDKPEEEKISLIKMGSEVYKPQSSVLINRDQIISIQNLNNDSQINKAIQNSINSK